MRYVIALCDRDTGRFEGFINIKGTNKHYPYVKICNLHMNLRRMGKAFPYKPR